MYVISPANIYTKYQVYIYCIWKTKYILCTYRIWSYIAFSMRASTKQKSRTYPGCWKYVDTFNTCFRGVSIYINIPWVQYHGRCSIWIAVAACHFHWCLAASGSEMNPATWRETSVRSLQWCSRETPRQCVHLPLRTVCTTGTLYEYMFWGLYTATYSCNREL